MTADEDTHPPPGGAPAGDAAAPASDGRRRRREGNRSAVVDALLDRYRRGDLAPTTDELAADAGISTRSLFRYFTDPEDLVGAAITRQQEHLAPRYLLPVDPETPLPRRIEGFVTARVELIEAMGPVAQVARLRAHDHPVIAAELTRIRTTLRQQVAGLFGRELTALGPDGPTTLALVDVAASWEAHHLLRHDQGLDRSATEAALVLGLTRLLLREPLPGTR